MHRSIISETLYILGGDWKGTEKSWEAKGKGGRNKKDDDALCVYSDFPQWM